MIDMKKKYTTRDGRPVRILAVDLDNDAFPVAVAVLMKSGKEKVCAYTAQGHTFEGLHIYELDLIEVPTQQASLAEVRRAERERCARAIREMED